MSCNRKIDTKRTIDFSPACYTQHRSQKHAAIKIRALFIVFLFTLLAVRSQKNNRLQWNATSYQELELNVPWASTIYINSSNDASITAVYQSEGEYQETLFLTSQSRNSALILTETRNPFGETFNDKLSAHKVIASTVSLTLPEQLSVNLKANNALVTVRGPFRAATIFLEEGKLLLYCSSLTGNIVTQRAPVEWYGIQHPYTARSKYGKIEGTTMSQMNAPVSIESTWGNIAVYSHRN